MDIDSILEELTLLEKAALLQGWSQWTTRGIPRLHIPEIFLSDGPHGMRRQKNPDAMLWGKTSIPATCFPTAATMANSWNPALGEALGRALGTEAAASDVHVVLGPGLNMKRSPLCGRNFEYFSEDPYLAGKMAAAYIRGIQENGCVACPKHFAVNSQELRRMSVDAVVDERTLREIYLTGFEIAVKEGRPKSIMSSYNMVNGTYANENSHLLTDILRKEWGFEGFVVSDWGADHDHVEGVRSGSNLVMPAPGADAALQLIQAVQQGHIPQAQIDSLLLELLQVIDSTSKAVADAPKTFDQDAHHALARECAAESIVLLENDGILPLHPETSVAIIGDFARTPRYQGAGSSIVNPTRLDNLLDCAQAAGMHIAGFAQGFSRTDPRPNPKLISEAAALAKAAEAVLLCIGLDETTESEGMDRTGLALPAGQLALVEAVSQANDHVILILSGGAPFLMPEPGTYRAALHGYLSGQAGASAMADAILGNINPSGKLSETWPLRLSDTPAHACFPSRERTAEHREGLYIGYRYYDTTGTPVRYPFGHGLSYTGFTYSDIHADQNQVTFTLTNTGCADGAEVAQVYIACPNGKIFRPKKELKGFAKVFLRAGERKTVTIPLDDKAFRYYNPVSNAWETETADYEISVAASVSDVRLRQTVHITGSNAPNPYGQLPSYRSGMITDVSDEEFAKLLGHPIPDGSRSGEFGRNDAICQLRDAKSIPARLLYKLVSGLKRRGEKKSPPDLNILFIYYLPLRGFSKVTNGMISSRMVDDVVLMLSGHFFRGTGRLIADFFRNLRTNKTFDQKLSQSFKE